MPTFLELQQRHRELSDRLLVLQHLIEYVDSKFRPVGGADPAHVLLNEVNLPVPASAFESVASEVLVAEANSIKEELGSINGASLAPAVPSVPVAPIAPVAVPAPVQAQPQTHSKKSKN